MSLRRTAALALPSILALLLLVPRLGWGFLSTAPGVPVVHTAEPDERHLTEGLLRMSLVPFRLDPGSRSWGGLSFTVLFVLVSAADVIGPYPGGWKAALLSGDLARAEPVLLTMRALSAACVVATACVAWAFARRRRGPGAGLLAAALVAVSPAMALSGRTFVTDALQAVLVAAAFLPASPAGAGLLLGLAAGTKYSALAFLPALVLAFPAGRRRALLWAVPLGFTLAAPFVVQHARSSAKLLLTHLAGVHGPAGASLGAIVATWGWHVSNAVLYLVGPLGLALAAVALARRRREGRGAGPSGPAAVFLVPLLLLAGQLAWLGASNFPVVRYQLPLVPFLAAWAAEALVDLRAVRTRAACAALALAAPAALSFLFVFGVPHVHPFESAGLVLRREAAVGAHVGRIWLGMPQLPGLASEELRAFTNLGVPPRAPDQDFIVDDDLPPAPFAPLYVAGRNLDYEPRAVFGGPPELFGIAWPRALTPHDARYSSPRVTVWRRRRVHGESPGLDVPSGPRTSASTALPGGLPPP